MPPAPQEPFATIRITGMTCSSCELLLERKIKGVPGVQSVDVNHKKGIALIMTDGQKTPSLEKIAEVVKNAGYGITGTGGGATAGSSLDSRVWVEIGASLIVIFALYKLLQIFDIASLAPSTSGALSFGGIFVIGLVAGTSSCLAVTGGLLLALAAKHNEMHQAQTPAQKFQPLLQFNVGRLLSYFVLGGLVGVLGQSITLGTRMTGVLNIAAALVMLSIALSILRIIPKGSFPVRPPKKLSHWIADISESKHPAAPFVLGALTFFLPCGFTQSLQLAALASGNFATGASIMLIFALGTLPSLLGISAISSNASGKLSHLFLRFSGTLVFVLALFNLNSGFALAGINLLPSGASSQAGAVQAAVNGEVQEVSMKATYAGPYEPNIINIKAGVPVRWKVDGTEAYGCAKILTIPSLGVRQALRPGENVIAFTPPSQPGRLAFMCSMGMFRGTFNVL
jgi:sulfite exporter TauE/SafE/copper chaperone CopZ